MSNVKCQMSIVNCDIDLRHEQTKNSSGERQLFRWASSVEAVTDDSVGGPSGRPAGQISSVCVYTNTTGRKFWH